MSTCFFIGHREAPETLTGELAAEVERHPEVTLTLLLPYHPYDRPTPTPPGFDGMFYPSGMETVPKRAAIIRANRYMVDQSEYLIAYAWHPGNARDLLEYAQRRKIIEVTVLDPQKIKRANG